MENLSLEMLRELKFKLIDFVCANIEKEFNISISADKKEMVYNSYCILQTENISLDRYKTVLKLFLENDIQDPDSIAYTLKLNANK